MHRGKDHRVTIELADERLNAPWLGMLAPNGGHWGNDDSLPADDHDSEGEGEGGGDGDGDVERNQ